MRIPALSGVLIGLAAAAASAQSPSSAFDRGASLQSWQAPGHAELVSACRSAPAPFRIGGGQSGGATEPPPAPTAEPSAAIPGVIEAGQEWEVVWAWEGNNADGPIAAEDGTMLFANNDASNVMQLDPDTGLATILHSGTNTGGALTRGPDGSLYVASRGLNAGILQLEPERRVFASRFRGEPLECIGGVLNDLIADSRGGVYLSITGGGVFYADANGEMSEFGASVTGANGIILSPDEQTLYVTNGPVVVAFDVEPDGSLTNQRDFASLRGGGGGDGSAVDQQGRLYVATGSSADVFAPSGEFLGSIPAPRGTHGVAFGGPDRRTLFGIVFYGGWGTPSARNQLIRIPTLAQGYTGRAK
ncbi:MAG TPA: SMP-30/gluconolactonase/LRE family protein [Gammaproteobacteria bacterium]|jgi:gluconolactonase